MDALVLTAAGQPLELQDRPAREPGEGEVVVELRAAALNRRDFWITRGLYPGIRTPCVLGSDGAGVVARAGPGVDPQRIGEEVVVDPALDWGPDERAQARSFRILGMPDDGTLAAELVVAATQVHPKPPHLDWPEAAALPLAGLTAYRALFRQGELAPGERVLVTGIGGGVAALALDLAAASGAEVLVTSSSPDKLRRARERGATGGISYAENGWPETLLAEHGPVDLVVDGAGGEGYARLLEVVRPGGRVVSYGSTAGAPPELDLFKLFWKQLRLVGSTMGSPADFAALLELVNQKSVRPAVDRVVPLANAAEAIDSMERSPQFGKIVIDPLT